MPTSAKSESQNALVVSTENTDLLFVPDELDHLTEFLPALNMTLCPLTHRQDVLAGLKNSCNIFHFAGHGTSDEVDPSRSALLLEDEPLSVADLRDCRLHESQPFLAYLSACSTSENRNEKLVDEAIHLVSACQMAGFRHSIGTLWEVYDECCAEVARIVYETLVLDDMTDTAVCWGLHKAVRFLRDQKVTASGKRNTTSMKKKSGNEQSEVGDLFIWAPYIHFGI
jgi:CHAT domain-containing protein